MRVFRRPGEFRTPDEPDFRPGRVPREDETGFEDRAPTLTFADVAGLDGVVADLRDVVGYVSDPDRYRRLGAHPPTGILLHGPPGCGKTLLGRALAGEVGVPFYFVSSTSFVERFVGLGASRIRELFLTASRDAPCIVFVDELDAVGRARTDGAGDREFDHTLNQLLVELDGFLGARGVITIGATNRPDLLDAALVRPGRFDRRIEIGRPDRAGREAVLRLHAHRRPCSPDVDWAKVAEATDGCSPAELAGLVNEAALLTARDGGDTVGWGEVERALDRLVGGGVRSAGPAPDELARRAAHEAGHALVALRRPHTEPNVRLSVLACGRDASTAWAAAGRRPVRTGAQLIDALVVLLAGRAAEQSLIGSPSTLVEADLVAAEELAGRIIRSGLVDPGELGDGRPGGGESGRPRPPSVTALLTWAAAEAERLVRAEPGPLRELAEALRAGGSLFVDEAEALLGPRVGAASVDPLPGDAPG